MIRCSLLLYLGMTFAAAIHAGPAENPTPGPDSSAPSKSPSEGFFKNDDLRLHYLDWGGTGHPIILLAALGETAHVFEDFAPAFTNSFRVLALTRRGFGKSDRAGNNYSLTDRVEDIRQLFHHLDLEKAHLIGHSIAGDEMTLFAIKHPELAGKLVYLDAASDRSKLAEVLDDTTPPPMRRLLSEALRLPDADQIKVPHLPKAEDWAALVGVVRASTQFSPDYRRIEAPALAFYSTQMDFPPNISSEERAKLAKWHREKILPSQKRDMEKFRSEIPNGKVIEMKDAHHFMILEPFREEVVRHTRSFLAKGINQ